MADDPLAQALSFQARSCADFGSHFYAALLTAAVDDLAPSVRALFDVWDGQPAGPFMRDAAPLRFLGALNDLVLDGAAPDLARAFPPAASDGAAAWPAARAAIEAHGSRLASFMGHEPQTNEVRRSACLLPAFLTVAAETGLPLRCLEIGASAGLNQLWRRYRYDYGAAGAWGDPASPVRLSADWRGPPPPLDAPLTLRESLACDRSPIDIRDPAARRRLKAYLWPDQVERIARFDAAADMAATTGIKVERAQAADWVRANGKPQNGVATVVFHSVVWQYIGAEGQAALRQAIKTNGAEAQSQSPLAWLRMEPNDRPPMMDLRLTLWPGGQERRLGTAQAHGAWIAWEAS